MTSTKRGTFQMTKQSPLFTTAEAAAEWTQPLPTNATILAGKAGYWAAAAEVIDAVEAEYCADTDPDDDDANAEARTMILDRVNNIWAEGLSHDEWVSATLRALRRA